MEYMRLNLETNEGTKILVDKEYLKPYEEEIVEFLDGLDYMKELKFARATMVSQEIKSNNVIEGIKDDLSIIKNVIKQIKENL